MQIMIGKNVTFRDELEEMKDRINLEIIHILLEPPQDWEREIGMIDREFLEKYLPENKDDYKY